MDRLTWNAVLKGNKLLFAFDVDHEALALATGDLSDLAVKALDRLKKANDAVTKSATALAEATKTDGAGSTEDTKKALDNAKKVNADALGEQSNAQAGVDTPISGGNKTGQAIQRALCPGEIVR